MSETRKLAAILVADIVGFSRLAGSDEERTLARIRALRGDLIDPAVAAHHGRIVKGTGDGALIEFRSVIEAVRCALEVQSGMIERNAGVPRERRIELRIGVHLGDVVEENDGDLMGDGVNIAARLEGIAKPGTVCLSEDAYRQVKGRLEMTVRDLGPTHLKNIAEQMRAYLVQGESPKRPSVLRHRLVAAFAASAILVFAGAAGWYRFVGNSSATSGSPAPPSSGPAVAVTSSPKPTASSFEPTTDTIVPTRDTPVAPWHAEIEHQIRPALASQPEAEPMARKLMRSARLKSPQADPAQSPSVESASNSAERCFVSAAHTNPTHSCAYLHARPLQVERAAPRPVESASDSAESCFVSAAQTNGNHSCAYLRGRLPQEEPAPPRPVESASNSAEPCFVSAAQTNAIQSCAHLHGY